MNDSVKGFRMRLEDDEKLMGGGERVLGMDRVVIAFAYIIRPVMAMVPKPN